MLKNYFKTTFRILWKQKTYTFIHVFGLAIGLASCLLIYKYVTQELNFEAVHSKKDRIFRVNYTSKSTDGIELSGNTPYPLGIAIRADFPDLPAVTRVHSVDEDLVTISPNNRFLEKNILFADTAFFDIFDFEIISGNAKHLLSQPNQLIISETLAKKYFGTENPIGKEVILGNLLKLNIAAIMKSPPENTHLKAEILVSFRSLTKEYIGLSLENWGFISSGSTYVLLPAGYSPERLEARFDGYLAKYLKPDKASKNSLYLQALGDIHFDTAVAADMIKPPINKTFIWIFALIGVFILVIACINFINLSTAQAIERTKEVGVRKVLGAGKNQLVTQYLGEAVVISIIAGIIAVQVAEFSLPFFNNITEKSLSIDLLTNSAFSLLYVTLLLLVGLLAGIYPAFILSGFEPIDSFKNQRNSANNNSITLRKLLVVGQFGITLILIIGTMVVSRQLNFCKNTNLGFDKEAIVMVDVPGPPEAATLKTKLLQHASIEKVTLALGAPTSDNNLTTEINPPNEDFAEDHNTNLKMVDHDYLETFGLQLVAGRWFTEEDEKKTHPSIPFEEQTYQYIINEAQAKALGFSNPEEIIGKKFKTGLRGIAAPIIGVVKDFNIYSLHEHIPPITMVNYPSFYYRAGIKVNTSDLSSSIAHIENVWSESYPDYLFDYRFLDSQLAALYEEESKTFQLIRTFAGLAILIACLGLWGLAAFTINRKTKEIGIRKVLGASTIGLVSMLNFQFAKLVIVAFLLASPIAYWTLGKWLENFAYSINLTPTIFLLAGLLAFAIASLTISFHTIKAAIANPVKALKQE